MRTLFSTYALAAASALTLVAMPVQALPTVDAAPQAAQAAPAALPQGHAGAGLGGVLVSPPIAGLEVSPVPEPSVYAMLLAGLAVVGVLAKRRGTRA